MGQIIAWKCDKTGKIFEDKSKYQKHIRKLAAKARIQKKIDAENAANDAWWSEFRSVERSVEDLMLAIVEHQDKFWVEAKNTDPWRWEDVGKKVRKGIRMPMPKVTYINLDVKEKNKVSNTHYCPKNGVTNWYCKKDLPDGYPGFYGQVSWYIEWPQEFSGWYPGGDLFEGRNACIYTGSGGGGSMRDGRQSFSHEVHIFFDDWPGLKAFYEKKKMMEILTKP